MAVVILQSGKPGSNSSLQPTPFHGAAELKRLAAGRCGISHHHSSQFNRSMT